MVQAALKFFTEGDLLFVFIGGAALSYGILMNAILRGVLKGLFKSFLNNFLAAIIFIPIFAYGLENEMGSIFFVLITIFTVSMCFQCRQEIIAREREKEAC